MGRRVAAAIIAIAAALAGPPVLATADGAQPAAAQVSVNPDQVLGSVPATPVGVNDAVWDGNLLDRNYPGLLRGAGVRALRYPGGSTADVYHWRTNSTEKGQSYANPRNTFDAFMGVVHRARAQPIITVNYGSGSPQEAAAWVRYANLTRHYGIRYWEIGNEVYGNGAYGPGGWEYDAHSQKGPEAYAMNVRRFIDAMKAVDPTIKIGVVLTAPGSWPDGVLLPGQSMDWNHTVLSIAGKRIDFATVHWYPQAPAAESDRALLAAPAQIPAMTARLRAEIDQYSGRGHGQVPITITEANSVSFNPGKQSVGAVNALFLADTYMGFLEQGVANVDWWTAHNGIVTGSNNSASLDGTAQYGDYGMLSSGTCKGRICEPRAETPFPAYYGLEMLAHVAVPGATIVGATSSQPLVTAHAVRLADGSLAVLLVNRDPTNAYQVNLAYTDFNPASGPDILYYGRGSRSMSEQRQPGLASALQRVIPPYSLTTIVVAPREAARL